MPHYLLIISSKECAGANQEAIMMCERCRGLKLLDRFYGMANDGSVWMYDGLRCVNCGSVTVPMMGEGAVNDAPLVRSGPIGIHSAFRP